MLSLDDLQMVLQCTPIKAAQWAYPLTVAMNNWGVTTKRQQAAFLAQISQETGGLTRFSENLNYSADRLAQVWPSRYAIEPGARVKIPNSLAESLHRQPERIANVTYANRMGNGPPESGDGWRYRGRGPKQVTGKTNYQAYFTAVRMSTDSDPNLLESEPLIGADAAGWYWHTAGCSAMIDRNDFRACTIAINGGLTGYEDGNLVGLDDRVELFENAKKVLQCS